MKARALGLIETVGLTAAIEAADTAVKAASVTLLGYELTRGGGLVTVKIEGDVGAVKASVNAAAAAAGKVGQVWAKHVIARPHEESVPLVRSPETVGLGPEQISTALLQGETQTPARGSGLPARQPADSQQKAEKTAGSPVEEADEPAAWMQDDKSADAGDAQGNEINEVIEGQVAVESQEPVDGMEVCNLCGDPVCPRRKGELRSLCIHYGKE